MPWHVWRSEHSFVEPVIPFRLHVGSKDWAPVARLAQQVSLPADPHHLPSTLVFEKGSLIGIELIWLDWLTTSSGSLLLWLLQCWNYKHVPLCSLLAFYWILFPDIKGLIFFFLDWTYWQGLESNIANTLRIHRWGLTPLYFSIHISDFIKKGFIIVRFLLLW